MKTQFNHPIGKAILQPTDFTPTAEEKKLMDEYQNHMWAMGLERHIFKLRKSNKRLFMWYCSLRRRKKFKEADYVRGALGEIGFIIIVDKKGREKPYYNPHIWEHVYKSKYYD